MCYAWNFELCEEKYKAFVNVTMNAFDRVTMFVLCFFLIFLTRWWVVIAMVYWALAATAFLVICFMVPESPNWHIMNNRKDKAIAILNRIAEVNGSDARISDNSEFTDMIEDETETDQDTQSYHSYIVSVAGGMNAASFSIQSQATLEQKTVYTRRLREEKAKRQKARMNEIINQKEALKKKKAKLGNGNLASPEETKRQQMLLKELEEEARDAHMPEVLHNFVVATQFVCMSYAGSFLGWMMTHIGANIFVNGLCSGLADCLANLTSQIIAARFGHLVTYRAFAVVTLVGFVSIEYFKLTGVASYAIIFVSVYCLGGSLLLAMQTMISELRGNKKPEIMRRTVTISVLLSATNGFIFLPYSMPIPIMGMSGNLAGIVLCLNFLID